jgi:hypothetical protein
MTNTKPPPAPDDLADAQARLWVAVFADHEMSDAEQRIFEDALRLAQRADEASTAVTEHGVTVLDRYGVPKINPAAELEIRCRTSSARLLAGLKLTLDEEPGPRPNGSRPGPKPKRKSR